MILAIDTSTARSCVAFLDPANGSGHSRISDGGHHAEVIMPLIVEVLQAAQASRADISRIVVGVGPGPFTGLRVGVMTARAMAFALGIPIVGVCSHDAIARAAVSDVASPVTVLTPARRREFYQTSYDDSGARVTGPTVVRADSLPVQGRILGSTDAPVHPDALWLARIAVEAEARGEAALEVAAATLEDDADSAGSTLAVRIHGHVLLAPEALYLRRPDAVPPSSVTATATVGSAPRRMRWWDIEDVVAIERQVFPTTAWSVGTFWSELAGAPDSRHYVVIADEHGITGYAGLAAHAPDAEVQTIAVAPRAQGRGLGAVLLDELIEEARRRECTRLMLEVRADNAPALALYASREFAGTGRRRDYYGAGIDAVLMDRRL